MRQSALLLRVVSWVNAGVEKRFLSWKLKLGYGIRGLSSQIGSLMGCERSLGKEIVLLILCSQALVLQETLLGILLRI